MPPLMGNEGDTHVRERSHLQGPQLLAHPSSLPSSPCLWPFLFNTIAHAPSLPPRPPSVSRSPSIYLSIGLSVVHISHAYNLCVRPDQMDLPSHQRFIFYFKSKRDMQLIVRDWFCCASSPSPSRLEQVQAEPPSCIFISAR